MSLPVFTEEQLRDAVKNSFSIAGVCRVLDIYPRGGSWENVKRHVQRLGLDTSHFTQKSDRQYYNHKYKRKPDEILIHRSYGRENGYRLRQTLLELGVEYKCVDCGNDGNWNDKKIRLQVDHVDGNNLNCTKENLEFVCPNCHDIRTQNHPHSQKKVNNCRNCRAKITHQSKWCIRCANLFKSKTYKVSLDKRPPKKLLEEQVESFGYVQVGKIYNVSDNTIRKWLDR